MTYLELFLAAAEEPDLYSTLIQKIRLDCDINDHEYLLKFNYPDKTMMKTQVHQDIKWPGVRLRSFTHNISYQLNYSKETNSLFFYDYNMNVRKGRNYECFFDTESITETCFNFNILFPEVPFDLKVLLKLAKISSEVGYKMWYGYEKKD